MTLMATSNHPGSQSSFINAANQSVLVGSANAQLIIYPDAGHGSIFQHHTDFVAKALA
jgi:pimeloyl-ACP methyl ester carboxylesterase